MVSHVECHHPAYCPSSRAAEAACSQRLETTLGVREATSEARPWATTSGVLPGATTSGARSWETTAPNLPREKISEARPWETTSGALPRETTSEACRDPWETTSGVLPWEKTSEARPWETTSGALPQEMTSGSLPPETASLPLAWETTFAESYPQRISRNCQCPASAGLLAAAAGKGAPGARFPGIMDSTGLNTKVLGLLRV